MRSLLLALLLASCAFAQQQGALSLPAYLEGLDALEEGRWDIAAGQFTWAIQQDSEKPAYLTALGVAFLFGEKFDKAKENLDQALRLRPDDAEARVWKEVLAVMRGGKPDKGDDVYASTMISLAARYAKVKTRDDAVAEFPRHVAWFVDRAKGWKDLEPQLSVRAPVEYDAGKIERALDDLQHIPSRVSDDAKLLLCRANCLMAMEDWQDAREAYTALLKQDPDNSKALLARACCEAQLGRRKDALADMASAAKALSDDGDKTREKVQSMTGGLEDETIEATAQKLKDMSEAAKIPETSIGILESMAIEVYRSAEASDASVPQLWRFDDTHPTASLRMSIALCEAYAMCRVPQCRKDGSGRLWPWMCSEAIHRRIECAKVCLDKGMAVDAKPILYASVEYESRISLADQQAATQYGTIAEMVAEARRLLEECKKMIENQKKK